MNFTDLLLQTAQGSNSLSPLLSSLIPQAGGGAILGYAGGWIMKKLAKILLFVSGVVAALFVGLIEWMESQGWITVTVNWTAVQATAQNGANTVVAGANTLIPGLTIFGAGGIAGLIIALHRTS